MCSHCWQKIADVWVCARCGITRMNDGRILFDRKLPNYIPKKKKKRGKK